MKQLAPRMWQVTEWIEDPDNNCRDTIITIIGAFTPCDMDTAIAAATLLRREPDTKMELFTTNLETKQKICLTQQNANDTWHMVS